MGFFNVRTQTKTGPDLKGMSVDLLHKHECSVCPLNNETGLRHPHMEPTGAERPDVYILGEAPGATEDEQGKQFVGSAGEVLRMRIPGPWLRRIRWNNVVRTRPPGNRNPAPVEIECCRPSIVRDIEKAKPRTIFGFGNVPLHWATGQSRISAWRGRMVPVQIGKHKCWFFPFLHPSGIGRMRKFQPRHKGQFGSEDEFAFALDLERAFALVDSLPEPVVHRPDSALSGIEWVDSTGGDRDVDRIVSELKSFARESVVGLDFETPVLRPYRDEAMILTMALSGRDHTFAFPIEHKESRWTEDQLERIWSAVGEFFESATCRKVVHHAGFEMEWCAEFFGRRTIRKGKWADTMAQAYVLDERVFGGTCHSLDFLCLLHFGINIKPLVSVNRKKMADEPLSKILPYNGLDSKYCRMLHFVQVRKLKQEGLYPVYKHHFRRIPALVLSQRKGLPVNQKEVRAFDRLYTKKLKKVNAGIAELPTVVKFKKRFGHPYNPGSDADNKKMFNGLLGLGLPNFDESVLKNVKHPLASKVLAYRNVTKLHSTYVKPCLEGSEYLYADGYLRPVYNANMTETSRTSSEDINAQNWPKRKNKEVRRQIKSHKPSVYCVAFDYAGMQARNIAMESEDRALVRAYWEKYDIHTTWMERFAKAYPRWVKEGVRALTDKEVRFKYRHAAKNKFVFPSMFGAQPWSMSKSLGIPEGIVTEVWEEFFDEFSGILKWQNGLYKMYRTKGYVAGHAGYRRRAPMSRNELINAPIQADEAFIVMDAMSRLSEMEVWAYQPNIEIHDDLTYFWPKNKIDQYAEVVIREMIKKTQPWYNVPLVVEMSVGRDWEGLQEVGEYSSDGWDGVVELSMDQI